MIVNYKNILYGDQALEYEGRYQPEESMVLQHEGFEDVCCEDMKNIIQRGISCSGIGHEYMWLGQIGPVRYCPCCGKKLQFKEKSRVKYVRLDVPPRLNYKYDLKPV